MGFRIGNFGIRIQPWHDHGHRAQRRIEWPNSIILRSVYDEMFIMFKAPTDPVSVEP